MDALFDRLGSLLRSLLNAGGTRAERSTWEGDEDFKDAWAELEQYLRGESPQRPGKQRRPDGDGSLGGDYANLQVPMGASLEEVKSAYKGLLRKYHPDRFARDPEKQRLANEVTQRINASYRRIMEHRSFH